MADDSRNLPGLGFHADLLTSRNFSEQRTHPSEASATLVSRLWLLSTTPPFSTPPTGRREPLVLGQPLPLTGHVTRGSP